MDDRDRLVFTGDHLLPMMFPGSAWVVARQETIRSRTTSHRSGVSRASATTRGAQATAIGSRPSVTVALPPQRIRVTVRRKWLPCSRRMPRPQCGRSRVG
ncbi:hypothetical protein [Microbacterium sp. NIBRBAC000506063]|uniref:hypothetical protein n=1 Tax=Microbacterium sp. NIBRBAC000506063 TaxID=2734618 RepID=UPI001BB62DED|nr:hypothetical protein [Microbacterium sp. NIBRBAC000506063]QTV80472.1 hypothetical protein KAE78_06085 [Microbacterium sp. NIBRBAC000506063]